MDSDQGMVQRSGLGGVTPHHARLPRVANDTGIPGDTAGEPGSHLEEHAQAGRAAGDVGDEKGEDGAQLEAREKSCASLETSPAAKASRRYPRPPIHTPTQQAHAHALTHLQGAADGGEHGGLQVQRAVQR